MKHVFLIIAILFSANSFTASPLFAKKTEKLIDVLVMNPWTLHYTVRLDYLAKYKDYTSCTIDFDRYKVTSFTATHNRRTVEIQFKNNKAVKGSIWLNGRRSESYMTSPDMTLTKADRHVLDAYTRKVRYLIKKYKIFQKIKAYKKKKWNTKNKYQQKKWQTALRLLYELE